MVAIDVEDLVKRYGDLTALDRLSLEIPDGELYGLLGPNGAGKTTTLEILTGRRTPEAGQARVLGIDPVAQPVAVRAKVGILPERSSPPSFMSGREYLAFVGAVRGMDEQMLVPQTDRWATELDMEGKLDTLSADLSRGQQQKIMIAAAFLHEPSLVFIDEPLSNLDPLAQAQVKDHLVSFQEAGGTLLLSTHNVAVAEEICTRVGILDRGQLIDELAPDQLDQPLLDVFVDKIAASRGQEAPVRG